MDIIDSCKAILRDKLQSLEPVSTQGESQSDTQTFTEGYFSEPDKNLNKILNQQSHLKRIIDQDTEIQMINATIQRVALEIESLRRTCTKENEDALSKRHELAEAQAKELERFQMAQIKSIADDYSRHKEILEQRKREIQSLNKEIEQEQKGRDAYLADVEKKLEKQLQDRQNALRGGTLPFPSTNRGENRVSLTDDLNNPNHIELTSVDEYAPYGAAPHSRMDTTARASGSRGKGRARGRRKRG